uniref:Uncharacterized protein n=1 Tax=Setaria italica TaxID=4555 RepID=K4AI02_SETIT
MLNIPKQFNSCSRPFIFFKKLYMMVTAPSVPTKFINISMHLHIHLNIHYI